jgi:hypothetical protein
MQIKDFTKLVKYAVRILTGQEGQKVIRKKGVDGFGPA